MIKGFAYLVLVTLLVTMPTTRAKCNGYGSRCKVITDCCSRICNFQGICVESNGEWVVNPPVCDGDGHLCHSSSNCCSAFCNGQGICEKVPGIEQEKLTRPEMLHSFD